MAQQFPAGGNSHRYPPRNVPQQPQQGQWGGQPQQPPAQWGAQPQQSPVQPGPQYPNASQQPRQFPQQGQWGGQQGSQTDDGQNGSDVIAKCATKGKFLDFRNNLIRCHDNDYAMLHGIGGAKYAAKSTIKMLMTDYTNSANVVVVSANITPELPYIIMNECMKNFGAPTVDISAMAAIVNQMMRESKLPPAPNGAAYLAVPEAAIQQLGSMLQGNNGSPVVGQDYSYRQERVNVYAQQNGFVPVSSLSITRTGMKGNSVAKLPWTVKISNFVAKPNPQQNGTTAYIGSTAQNQKEVFISVSDADMFRCMKRVCRFIEVWETALCEDLVRKANEQKEMERQQKNQRY